MEEDQIAQWMEAYRDGHLAASLNENPSAITAEAALKARSTYEAACHQNPPDVGLAVAASAVAAALYERLGQYDDQIRNFTDFLQLGFMQANTPAEYKAVRDMILSLLGYADRQKCFDLAFELQVNAADCSFFAFTANDFDLSWLKITLADILAGCKRAPDFRSSIHFDRLVDLIANAGKRAITRVMPDADRAQIDQELIQLTAETNAIVPVDFRYRNDPEQTSRIVFWLDQMNQNYGRS